MKLDKLNKLVFIYNSIEKNKANLSEKLYSTIILFIDQEIEKIIKSNAKSNL